MLPPLDRDQVQNLGREILQSLGYDAEKRIQGVVIAATNPSPLPPEAGK